MGLRSTCSYSAYLAHIASEPDSRPAKVWAQFTPFANHVDMKFAIVDDAHCEVQGPPYPTREAAMAELQRRASIPWNEAPNRAPCTSWAKCGRQYVIEEYDDTEDQISRLLVLQVSAKGVEWRVQPSWASGPWLISPRSNSRSNIWTPRPKPPRHSRCAPRGNRLM